MILLIKIKSKNIPIHTTIHIDGCVHFSYELNNRKKVFFRKTVHTDHCVFLFRIFSRLHGEWLVNSEHFTVHRCWLLDKKFPPHQSEWIMFYRLTPFEWSFSSYRWNSIKQCSSTTLRKQRTCYISCVIGTRRHLAEDVL